MMENWCRRSGLEWGYGIGAGGGGMVSALANVPAGRGRAHPLGKRFAVLQRTAPHKEPEKQSLSRWIFPDLPTKLLRKWVGDRL